MSLAETFVKYKKRAWPALGVLLIVPGAAGALGGTALEAREVSGLDMMVTYAPETHLHENTVWQIDDLVLRSPTGSFSVRFAKDELKHFKIIGMSPAPLSKNYEGEDEVYTFSVKDGSRVNVIIEPSDVGRFPVTLQYGVDPPVAFAVTTLP